MKTLQYVGAPGRREYSLMKWAPAMFGVLVICMESTRTMGAGTTFQVLQHLLGHVHASIDFNALDEVNHLLRKSGHFLGYGMLGLVFAHGWLSYLSRYSRHTWTAIRMRAAAYGIGCAACVASMDEIHQIFLPGRGASVWDVLLDTTGATLLVTISFTILLLQRRRLLMQRMAVRGLLQRQRKLVAFERSLRRLDMKRRTRMRVGKEAARDAAHRAAASLGLGARPVTRRRSWNLR